LWFWETSSGPLYAATVEIVVAAVNAATPGSYAEVEIPLR